MNVGGMSCGSCSYNPGANTATCSGWTINGQACSFSVMSVICGGMTGEPSESVDIVIQGMYMLVVDTDLVTGCIPVAMVYCVTELLLCNFRTRSSNCIQRTEVPTVNW